MINNATLQIEKFYNNKVRAYSFWKGRVALYAILKSLKLKKGDEVILPGFTCVVVPNAIIYNSAKPVYCDIDSKTFTNDINSIEKKITNNTKVIIAQNTFGLSPKIDEILSLAKKKNIYVIEDSAHGFGSKYNGSLTGTLTDAAFFSSQWNKIFSTGIGGFAVINNELINNEIVKLQSEIVNPSKFEELILQIEYFIKNKIVNAQNYNKIRNLYRKLSELHLLLGSNNKEELETNKNFKGYFKNSSTFQNKIAIVELINLENNLNSRKKIANHYIKFLTELNLSIPFIPDYTEHLYLYFPLLINDKIKFYNTAKKLNIELNDWFVSPLHPVENNLKNWGYNSGDAPMGEKVSGLIVNLPTHDYITENILDKYYALLKLEKENILDYNIL